MWNNQSVEQLYLEREEGKGRFGIHAQQGKKEYLGSFVHKNRGLSHNANMAGMSMAPSTLWA